MFRNVYCLMTTVLFPAYFRKPYVPYVPYQTIPTLPLTVHTCCMYDGSVDCVQELKLKKSETPVLFHSLTGVPLWMKAPPQFSLVDVSTAYCPQQLNNRIIEYLIIEFQTGSGFSFASFSPLFFVSTKFVLSYLQCCA